VSGASYTPLARILAAADVFHALTELRPQRPPLAIDQAASTLASMAEKRELCPDAVAGVLEAAGQPPPPRPPAPAGLTEREVAVLRLVARGLTNKEVAVTLDISVKTAGNHIQHIFGKIGVTTRAAAAVFAMQHGLATYAHGVSAS
jgi:DNA-binding NarL/FixJ family response regulator